MTFARSSSSRLARRLARSGRALRCVVGATAALCFVACTDSRHDEATLARGQVQYASKCALCHGPRGEGYIADQANALANPEFLSAASDAFLEHAIVRGRPGTTMSPWGTAFGGPLTDDDARAIVRVLRSWQTVASNAPESRVGGEALRGASLYAVECASCHGREGRGGPFLSVTNPEFLASASDGYLFDGITLGRSGTPMPAFAPRLSELQRLDLVAYLRSLAVDPLAPPAVLPTFDPARVVQNPAGPDPAFIDDPPRFLPGERLKAAYDSAARVVVLDARPPADYVAGHIQGAQSMPFYAVDIRVDLLPRDVWIVTYCGCPHAESGALADQLSTRGFSNVRVLDEGFGHWRAQGWPTRGGAEP